LIENCVIRGNEAPTYYTDANGDWVATHLADYTSAGFSDTVNEIKRRAHPIPVFCTKSAIEHIVNKQAQIIPR